MPDKPKVAFYWCASCGGCEESVVDLAEDILGVVDAVDIVFWPVAMDFKRSDVEAMADGSILVSLINGAIRSTEQEEMVRMLRRKSQLVIAYGACAHLGGIPGLANQFAREQILKFVYEESPSTQNAEKTDPTLKFQENGRTATLPELHRLVRTLDQVIEVDYYLPGCPPTPKLLQEALTALLSGTVPPKGSRPRPGHRPVRGVPAQGHQADRPVIHDVQAPAHVRAGSGEVPPGPGVPVHGPGDPRRLRGALRAGEHALHRLLRTHLAGQGPRGEDPLLDLLQRRRHG